MKTLTTRCHSCQFENQDTPFCATCNTPIHYSFNDRQPQSKFPQFFVQRLFFGAYGEKDFYREIEECVNFIEKFSRFRFFVSVNRLPELSRISSRDMLHTTVYMATAEDADLQAYSDGNLSIMLWKLLPGQSPSFTSATWGHEFGGIGEYRPYSSIPYNVWWWDSPNEGWQMFGSGILAQTIVNQLFDVFEEIGFRCPLLVGEKKHPVSAASYERQKKRLQSITKEMYEAFSARVQPEGNLH